MTAPSVAPLGAFDLTGRTAAITGAASGIGELAAEYLAACGASVVIGDVDDAGLERVAGRIRGNGGAVSTVHCDVARQEDCNELVATAVREHGQLDIMANVAGMPGDGMVEDITEARLDAVFGVNVKGVLFGCQAAMHAMKPRGTGSIVNVASAAIDCAVPNASLYAMSKAAVAMLTMDLAVEAGPFGVRVNAIAPGATLTKFTTRSASSPEGVAGDEEIATRVEAMKRMSPLGRVGEPADQALQILYLASDAARFVTGTIMRANGGVAIGW